VVSATQKEKAARRRSEAMKPGPGGPVVWLTTPKTPRTKSRERNISGKKSTSTG
jgi:hypothetical protein